MSLAARLDRLRGCRHSDAETFRPPRRVGRVPVEQAASVDPDRLAACLQGEHVGGGLVICERSEPVPSWVGDIAMLKELPETARLAKPAWLYLDTETTGLSGGVGNLAFMVGVARFDGAATLRVRQYLIAGFAAESRMLSGLGEWLGRERTLVSFNGKCFDLPLLASRLALHRQVDSLSGLGHLDLMYPLRRAYRSLWPDCRLQTAERLRLDLLRDNDLPGAEAPAAWRRWLRHGDARPLARVLAHNHQDVVSLALLHAALARDYQGGAGRPIDHARVARAWAEHGDAGRARAIREQARELLDERGLLDLAADYRRLGRWREAEAIWLRLDAHGNPAATLALSKFYEHRCGDPQRALLFARRCEPAEHRVRASRLVRKIEGGGQLSLASGGLWEKAMK